MKSSSHLIRAITIGWLCLVSSTVSTIARSDETTSSYAIQPGDILEISVWKEEDLLRQVLVLPDGRLSFPLVGNVLAAGKSVTDLQALIKERLRKYIPDPVVTVSIQQLSGNKFYVTGKVMRPGEFVANRYMDVVQALGVAGGMTPFASANNIKILRRVNGELTAIPFRYGDIEKGKDLEQDIFLQSGDVVVVP
jgi:polysaccharide export outer membrane protein